MTAEPFFEVWASPSAAGDVRGAGAGGVAATVTGGCVTVTVTVGAALPPLGALHPARATVVTAKMARFLLKVVP